jgi:DNA repair ATPase RecN
MAHVTNALLYDVLKALRCDVSEVKGEVRDLKGEFQAMRSHLTAVAQDISTIYGIADRQDQRLERIETRLGLLEPAR